MTYDSTIAFTLDTICPWTYLGYLRLSKALKQYRDAHPTDSPVNFTLKFLPYQLYPDFSTDGIDKYEWYKSKKYDDNEEKMAMFAKYMGALGEAEGVTFDFHGTIANTMNAHRVLQVVQERKGEDGARKAVDSLYEQYFTKQAHPSSTATLSKACIDAGLSEQEAKELVNDDSEGLMDVKMAIREQAGNGVDSVPYVVFEGRKRDFTLVGAKEVGEYLKTLEQVAKEA
ncbi:thioredoxin-like protein [Aaosphaeria arxii CBS 175.79]|uniref:Thioredoxin-like protein n=1 Tax=Aaosphaeria arxii CBS 175.79 TaxID=1450172 RepID=A0A6A5XPZ4_9PLEO|nr:thioredoxin-like protein [Aaosphaeria arxii CBS 175.79]KAF2014790.1 thioredoxin-like protein [Aaosphaeria arxii CBS 175.79]